MKCRLRKFPLIHLLLLYFILLLSEKMYFTANSKNIHYACNIYGIDLDVNVCRGVFRTHSNIYVGASFQKSQESFIVDVRLVSKYASCIGFTVEKVYKMSMFI